MPAAARLALATGCALRLLQPYGEGVQVAEPFFQAPSLTAGRTAQSIQSLTRPVDPTAEDFRLEIWRQRRLTRVRAFSHSCVSFLYGATTRILCATVENAAPCSARPRSPRIGSPYFVCQICIIELKTIISILRSTILFMHRLTNSTQVTPGAPLNQLPYELSCFLRC